MLLFSALCHLHLLHKPLPTPITGLAKVVVVQIKRSDHTEHIIKASQQKRADQTLADLYPQLIQWFEQVELVAFIILLDQTPATPQAVIQNQGACEFPV